MKVTCPHCNHEYELNVGRLIGAVTSKAKSETSRLNGALSSGRPRKKNPVRLRPYHPQHPRHAEWLAEQERKKTLGDL